MAHTNSSLSKGKNIITDDYNNNETVWHILIPPFPKGRLGGISMLYYRPNLKKISRVLRSNLTDSEQRLWYYLRKKQLLHIQFFRQRPIGNYIVDFYAPTLKLVIEVDSSQHFEKKHKAKDKQRDTFLENQGIKVLRFDNLEVLQNTEGVLETVLRVMEERKRLLANARNPS